jgi:hypothetical protein
VLHPLLISHLINQSLDFSPAIIIYWILSRID